MDHDLVDPASLPDESAIAAVTLAELAAGPHATSAEQERARRQDRLQWAEATWDPLPFNAEAAQTYGRVFAATRGAKTAQTHTSRGPAHRIDGLPLYTRNPADFAGPQQIVTVVAV